MWEQFKTFVLEAEKKKATDIHVSSKTNARLRVAGQLREFKNLTFDGKNLKSLLKYFLTPETQLQLKKQKYIQGFVEISDTLQLRHCISVNRDGFYLNARLLHKEIRTWDSLNIPKIALNFLEKKQGLILLSGPLSSGKTSTLTSFIEYLNGLRNEHIIYVDELIEHDMKSKNCIITSRQLKRDTLCYESALKNALREDPDIVVIGDISRYESAQFALDTAETGHLVIGVVSTVGALNSVSRVLNSFPASELDIARSKLAAYLIGVISQVLVPDINRLELLPVFEVFTVSGSMSNNIRTNKMMQLQAEFSRSVNNLTITFDDYAKQLKQQNRLAPDWTINDFTGILGSGSERNMNRSI
jgi:twitching motility protein PilT